MEKLFNTKENKFLRRKLRTEMPEGEILLWQKINNRKMGYKFRRQHSIGQYVVDFYCPKLKLVIEVDGFTHNGLEKVSLDKERQHYIESLGIKIIRFSSAEIFADLNGVVNQIYFVCQSLRNNNLG